MATPCLPSLRPSGPDLSRTANIDVKQSLRSALYPTSVIHSIRLSRNSLALHISPTAVITIYLEEWYLHPFESTNVAESPQRILEFSIGYDNITSRPWRFSLRPHETIDVGFFKLFLTKSPRDFRFVAQGCPFTQDDEPILTDKLFSLDVWGTATVTVLQRRG